MGGNRAFFLGFMFMMSDIHNCLGHWLVPRPLGEVTLVVGLCVKNIWLVAFSTAMIVKD